MTDVSLFVGQASSGRVVQMASTKFMGTSLRRGPAPEAPHLPCHSVACSKEMKRGSTPNVLSFKCLVDKETHGVMWETRSSK